MNPLLEQFLSEARDFLQTIGEKLMALEKSPEDKELLVSLFRDVHTLKGNSGLFEFPDMTRVLHAGEDLMDAVRNGRIPFTQALADQLLDAMDFVGMLCDEIGSSGGIAPRRAADSARLAADLRLLIALDPTPDVAEQGPAAAAGAASALATRRALAGLPLADLPEAVRLDAYARAQAGAVLHWVSYQPISECFFQGDDPFYAVRQTPDTLWVRIVARQPWGPLAELDAYSCRLGFELLSAAPHDALSELFRYVPDQVSLIAVPPCHLVIPQGDPNGGPVYGDFVSDALQLLDAGGLASLRQASMTMLHLSSPDLWLSSALRWLLVLLDSQPVHPVALRQLIDGLRTLTSPDWLAEPVYAEFPAGPALSVSSLVPAAAQSSEWDALFAAQRQILLFEDQPAWLPGRLRSVASVLVNCCKARGDEVAQRQIEAALACALEAVSSAPLLDWLAAHENAADHPGVAGPAGADVAGGVETTEGEALQELLALPERRPDDVGQAGAKSIKVDQAKLDRLMNLIGEMVVSKNALPYLALRAEEHYGVRELAREIKAQFAVINRIAEEMQDAIMQVRMLPVSFVFQRFPRLVRDISRKLGKEVELVLEGEETEADKNIIESLADPLIHIVRNSLDHGLETPQVRRAAGKDALGKLTIRAVQEGDRVLIDIIDDGRGIDPAVVKRKAWEKGLIDEATLERISDREAVNLVFAAGFSTAEVVSDLSGRGVGMDVVRTAVEKVNGSITLDSEVGKGTRLRITLPLSMAVTKVMIVESDQQVFGIPMDHVVETVRVPCADIRRIKQSQTMVLRGAIVPLKALNTLLGLASSARANADQEMAVLVVKIGGEPVGLLVDDFHETAEIIQKPLTGVLAGLAGYSGSALMGDGSVLMVLNVREMI